jgi:hypothetical protein
MDTLFDALVCYYEQGGKNATEISNIPSIYPAKI